MYTTLRIIEPLTGKRVPVNPYSFGNGSYAAHEITRLLLGSADVVVISSGKRVCLTENYCRFTKKRLRDPEAIKNFIFESDITLDEYKSFLHFISTRNKRLFEDLRNELLFLIFSMKIGRYTEAFLYLYRILEMISVAIPLIYVTKIDTYKGALDFLKSIVSDEKSGDLKVLSKAMPTIARVTDVGDLTLDFSAVGFDVNWLSLLIYEISQTSIDKTSSFVPTPSSDIAFQVKVEAMPDLITAFRNRMFHYKISEKNINLGRIGGADLVCKLILPESLYWLSLVYLAVLKASAKRIL